MPAHPCEQCHATRALIIRPKNHQKLCKACFLTIFESEIHETILENKLFHRGERISIGASGGKDSTVLASVLKTLNERYDYGLKLELLSIDEGIRGYRDDSLETVKRNALQYDMPLTILGYAELYGWTMDQVVSTIGRKGNCTYCGVFRRQALDRGAARLGITHVVTGHNADDIAETVLMNLLRGDLPRLARATSIVTQSAASNIKRSKPLKYAYEKEIVLYAYHKKLDYFSTECVYSPEAFRGTARTLIKEVEQVRSSSILDVVRSGEEMAKMVPAELLAAGDDEEQGASCGSAGRSTHGEDHLAASSLEVEVKLLPQDPAVATDSPARSKRPSTHERKKNGRKRVVKQTMGKCERCGYISSQSICKACTLLEGLNKARPATHVQIGVHEEEASTTMMRQVGALEIEAS